LADCLREGLVASLHGVPSLPRLAHASTVRCGPDNLPTPSRNDDTQCPTGRVCQRPLDPETGRLAALARGADRSIYAQIQPIGGTIAGEWTIVAREAGARTDPEAEVPRPLARVRQWKSDDALGGA